MSTFSTSTPYQRTTYYDARGFRSYKADEPGFATFDAIRAGLHHNGPTGQPWGDEYCYILSQVLEDGSDCYNIDRTALSFDTSSIPSGVTITSAVLKFRVASGGADGDLKLVRWTYDTADFAAIVSGIGLGTVWDEATSQFGLTADAVGVYDSPGVAEWQYVTFDLNVEAIVPGGLTQFLIATAADYNASDPGGNVDPGVLYLLNPVNGNGSLEIEYTPLATFSFTGPNAFKLMGATSAMEYSLDGGSTYTQASTDIDLTAQFGQMSEADGIRVRYIGDVAYQQIALSYPAPEVTLTFAGALRYQLYGATSDMEYSIGAGYTTCSTNLSIEAFLADLVPATGIVVRYIAFPSSTQTLSVAPTDTTFLFDGANGMKLMGSDDTMEYSLDGEATYTTCTADTDLTEFLNTADWTNFIRIRYVGAIVPYVITLESPPAAPDVTFEID